MNVLILAHNERQMTHYERNLWFGAKTTKFHYARDERYLYGFIPDLIIELPDWPTGKSEEFMMLIDEMKKRMHK